MPSKKAIDVHVPTLNHVAGAFGVSREAVADWRRGGMPGRDPGGWSLGATASWLRTDGPWKPRLSVGSDDPLMDAAADSPALEQYRRAKAALAELDLDERRGVLMRWERVQEIGEEFARHIRRAGERLQKRFGPDASKEINRAIQNAMDALGRDARDDNSN